MRWAALLAVVALVVLAGFTFGPTQAPFRSLTSIAYGPISGGGVLVTSGTASIDAGSTATPFLVQGDTYYVGACSAAACVTYGPYASCSMGDPNQAPPVAATTQFQIYVPRSATPSLAAAGQSGSVSCAFWPGIR